MSSIGDYNEIMSNRNLFNKVVYTPLSEALRLLDERQKDPELIKKIEELLNGDIPEILKDKKCGVQFRQIASPNHDACHFISISQDNELRPIFFEYLEDKFTSNNEYKHSLGQLRIQQCVNKNDCYPVEKITIVDFNKFNGKKLKEVVTLWNEPLINFHRRLFKNSKYPIDDIFFYDASLWFKNNGGKATDYYTNFFLLFISHAILFENFLLNEDDNKFTKMIVLPAIEKVFNLTGLKPLIVPIGPIEIETDDHWISYSSKIKNLIY